MIKQFYLLGAFCAFAIFLPTCTVRSSPPTLDDYWRGNATFEVEIEDTGLPMGESETIIQPDGDWWSYVHASDRSAGTVDQCGAPVEFPGCVVIYESSDDGNSFAPQTSPPTCMFECDACPCERLVDNIDQQQYPRLHTDGEDWAMVYEFGAMTRLRTSDDGINWSSADHIPQTGVWNKDFAPCYDFMEIGEHPHVESDFECLAGGPPGVYIQDETVYIFLGLGKNPASMGCYTVPLNGDVAEYQHCENNPQFTAPDDYGPTDNDGPGTEEFYGFRTITSAEILKVGNRFYMLFEGVRGPAAGEPGDTQFGLGLARSRNLDGGWEVFDGNPILIEPPGNIGVGHADLVVFNDITYMYTSLDGVKRSRLKLVWNE